MAQAPTTGTTGFDVEAARKEGYSDDDILAHLTSSRKFDVDAAIKEGYDKKDIIDHLAATPSKSVDSNAPYTGPTIGPQPPSFIDKYIAPYLPSARTALRTTGAAVGGTLGAAGGTVAGTPIAGVGGAALGGAAGASIGESAYQLGQRLGIFDKTDMPETGGDAALSHSEALATGAAQEALPVYVGAKAPAYLRESAAKDIAQAVRPSTEGQIREARDAANVLMAKIPFAKTSQEMVGGMEAGLGKASAELEALYSSVPTTHPVSSTPIIQGLEKARDNYLLRSTSETIPGSNGIVKQYQNMIDWFKAHPNFSVQELRQQRQVWDQTLNWWKGSMAKKSPADEVVENTANLVRNQINTTFPDIGAKNAEVSSWKTLHDLSKAAEPKDWIGGAAKDMVPYAVAGAGAGMLTGHPSTWGAGVASAWILRQVTKTAAWKTASAIAKSDAADLIEKGSVDQAMKLLSRGGSMAEQGAVKGAVNFARATLRPPPQEQPATALQGATHRYNPQTDSIEPIQ